MTGLLLEGDLAGLLKVLLTDLFLSRLELSDIGVVALLDILVRALKNGVLLQGGDGLLLLHAAQAGVGVGLAAAEVDAARDDVVLLARLPSGVDTAPGRTLSAEAEAARRTITRNWGQVREM